MVLMFSRTVWVERRMDFWNRWKNLIESWRNCKVRVKDFGMRVGRL